MIETKKEKAIREKVLEQVKELKKAGAESIIVAVGTKTKSMVATGFSRENLDDVPLDFQVATILLRTASEEEFEEKLKAVYQEVFNG